MTQTQVKLWVDDSEESRKAVQLLREKGVEFRVVPASEGKFPCIQVGFVEYYGLEGVHRFLGNWKRFYGPPKI